MQGFVKYVLRTMGKSLWFSRCCEVQAEKVLMFPCEEEAEKPTTLGGTPCFTFGAPRRSDLFFS